MPFDISNITSMKVSSIVNMCNEQVAVPALLILFFAGVISFLVWGMIIVKESRKKLMLILVLTFLTMGLILLALVFLPNSFTMTIADFFSKLKN